MKTPPPALADQLVERGEEILRTESLRLEDVARLVGTSRARLYYYFAGQDDLRTFLLLEHTRTGGEVIAEAAATNLSPPERLGAVVEAMAGFLGRRPGLCLGLLGAAGSPATSSAALAANDEAIAAPLRGLLTDGVSTGAFAVDDVADAADAILGAVLLAVLGRTGRGGVTDRTFTRALAGQVVRGVVAEPR